VRERSQYGWIVVSPVRALPAALVLVVSSRMFAGAALPSLL
jgi:hypothetical protein